MNIDESVVEVLDNADIDGSNVQLTGQLDRALYVRVNKVLEAIGGKWNRKAKSHSFDGDPTDAIETAILTRSVDVPKKNAFDFFETPPAVAEQIVELAIIRPEHRILEPSAGSGRILDAVDDSRTVNICEIDPERARSFGANPKINVVGGDFLRYNPGPVYDRIIANPPFSKRRDIHHVRHMYHLLKPLGRLVSVMANGVTFRTNRLTTEFLAEVNPTKVIPLPDSTFKESGTGVNTVIFIADKP